MLKGAIFENDEFLSTICQITVSSDFFPIFNCVDSDSYPEYGSGSTQLLNTDLIWIQIPDTGSKTNFRNFLLRATGKNGTDAARLI